MGVSFKLLNESDRVIVVAGDIPEVIFNLPLWKNKVIYWKIPDELGENKRNINNILKSIQGKVDALVKQLGGKNENKYS